MSRAGLVRGCCGKLLVSLVTCLGLLTFAAESGVARAHPVNAGVMGKLRVCTGPPRQCKPQRRATITVFDSQHHVVAKKHVTNGYFSFVLRPGRYRLYATDPEGSRTWHWVSAKAHKTIRDNITFHRKNSYIGPPR